MNNSIKSTIERTRQYWYIDGFNEMLTGVIFLLLAAISYIGSTFEPSPLSAILVGAGYPAVILLGMTAGRKVVNQLKTSITYPRTGYVQYIRPEPGERRKRAIRAGMISAVTAILVITILNRMNPMFYVITTGSCIALFMVMLAARIPLPRFYGLALWTALLTLTSTQLLIGIPNRLVILLAGCGLGLVVSGIFALTHYLNHTEPASPMEGED